MTHHPLRRPRAVAGLAAAAIFLASGAADALGCTLAVFSGKATRTGRPLMWKNRDTSKVDNKLRFFSGGTYGFVGLVDADNVKGDEVYGGLNEAGFAIMNSQSDDLASPQKGGDGNGALMKLALATCATIGDFEALLLREKGRFDLAANFGTIDARGGAAFFETGSDRFQKFDAADPRVAPFGYIVRTNFAFTSPDPLQGGGFIRFERISRIVQAARAENRVDTAFILRSAARDLVNEKIQSFPLARELPADPAVPLYINTNDTINRNSSVSAMVFDGAPVPESASESGPGMRKRPGPEGASESGPGMRKRPGPEGASESGPGMRKRPGPEKPWLATMWVLLGQPVCGVAVPVWPAAGTVPAVLTGQKTAPLNDFTRALALWLYPDRRGRMPQYLNVTRLRTFDGEGVLPKLRRIEDDVLARAEAKLEAWGAARPAAAEAAEFEETLAAGVFAAMRAAFPDLQ